MEEGIVPPQQAKAVKGELFSVLCPYLNIPVFLHKHIWYDKILVGHTEMRGKYLLVKEIASSPTDPNTVVYRSLYNPIKMAVFRKSAHLWPRYQYVRVGIDIIDDGKQGKIITAYGTNTPPDLRAMEEIR